MLKFGLATFGDVTESAAGGLLPYADVLRNVVDEGTLADQVGVDFFGVGEHHRAEFAVSAPEIVLAAVAARTSRITLGTAVTVLSSDDPVRLFQRFATLQAISRGRAEIIMGRGAFTESFPLFGHDQSNYEALFNEKLELFVALLRKQVVTWRGTTRAALAQQIVYPPLQGGSLKTWVGVGATPASVLRAARFDLPLMLGIVGGEPGRFKAFVDIYHAACAKLGRPARDIGVHVNGHIAETDSQARDEFWQHYKPMRDRLGAERGWPPMDRAKFANEVERGALFVGSPETVAQKIAVTVTQLGASRFDLKYSVGTLPQVALRRSIELFGRQVVPRVRAMI